MESQSTVVPSELIRFLNSATSSNPDEVVTAGNEFLKLTSSNQHVYCDLARVVFSHDQTDLSVASRFIGLLQLKNLMFDGRVWQHLDLDDRHLVQQLLLSYLASGQPQNPDLELNQVEQLPQIGPCLGELVARLVRNEWSKPGWSNIFWEHLINWSAWLSLRSGLLAAASFRLPARRRQFSGLIQTLLPVLLTKWESALGTLSNIQLCIHHSRILYTCISSIGGSPNDGPFVFTTSGHMTESIFRLAYHVVRNLSPSSPHDTRLLRRLTKLILVVFMACAPDLRSQFVHLILSEFESLAYCNRLDDRSMMWLMGLFYGILCSTSDESASRLVLSAICRSEIQTWLFMPALPPLNIPITSTQSVRLFHLLEVLCCQYLPLTTDEIHELSTDPEGCLSTGGSSRQQTAGSIDLGSIWHVDGYVINMFKFDLRSLLGMNGSERHLLGTNHACRQFVQLLVLLCSKYYGRDGLTMLFNMLQQMHQSASTTSQMETIMRLVQICLIQIDPQNDGHLIEWIDRLIQTALDVVQKNLMNFSGSSSPQSINREEQVFAQSNIVLLTRIMSVQARLIVFLINTSYKHVFDQYRDRFLHFLIDDYHLLPISFSFCIRLCLAECLDYLIDQPAFEIESINISSVPVLKFLVKLIQDAYECETRIYVLNLTSKLIGLSDWNFDLEVTNEFVGLLDQLWHLGDASSAAALRAAILNAICTLTSVLNASSHMEPQLLPIQSALLPVVIYLVKEAMRQSMTTGFEALFEPGIRLWYNLVSGDGACWSRDVIDQLMPILVGDHNLGMKPLIDRLETAEETEVFFNIAQNTLLLTCKKSSSGGDGSKFDLIEFLQTWSEPFWSSVFINSRPMGNGSCSDTNKSSLDLLYSNAASLADDHVSDRESPCRIIQLNLFSHWLAILLDSIDATISSDLAPSMIGLLILTAKSCLKRAPISAHDDICPLATQSRLTSLAILACHPNYWNAFLHVLRFMNATDNEFTNVIRSLSPNSALFSQPPSEDVTNMVEICLERWLARADSLTNQIDRRCYALACLMALTSLAHTTKTQTLPNSANQLDEWAANDHAHANSLESVISICVQVLYSEDDKPATYDDASNFPHPKSLSTFSGFLQRLQQQLFIWQQVVGGPTYADHLFQFHVEPVLLEQLKSKLVSRTDSMFS